MKTVMNRRSWQIFDSLFVADDPLQVVIVSSCCSIITISFLSVSTMHIFFEQYDSGLVRWRMLIHSGDLLALGVLSPSLWRHLNSWQLASWEYSLLCLSSVTTKVPLEPFNNTLKSSRLPSIRCFGPFSWPMDYRCGTSRTVRCP